MIRIYSEYEKVIQKTVEKVADRLDFNVEDIDVEISFADEEEIKSLNNSTRGIDRVTDVLSYQNVADISLPLQKEKYPEDINGEDDSLMLGEIIICDEQAKRQAEEYGHSLEREIAFLTCHGMLHLLGFDHEDSEGEKEMNDLCEEILTKAGFTREITSVASGGENSSKEGFSVQDETDEEESFSEEINKGLKRDFHSGFVAVMGKPNAGKSTLINTIVGEKVAIVSWKPQTTRNKIIGIYNEKNYQIIFIDTPGLHKPKNTLGEYMMKTASTALDGVDCVLYVVDCEKGYDEKDKFNIVSYTNSGLKVIVVVNKVDHVTKEKVFEILTELNNLKSITAVVPTSALCKRNIEPLKDEIKKLLTDTIKYYPDEQYTDRNMRFMASEVIREKALRLLDKEVPYGIGVDIREYRVRENGIIDINADIICEKSAHKPIILGKGGAMIKKIATYARQDLEEMTGSKIFLTLFVRVKDDWRGSDFIMRELGYDTKNPD